MFPFFYNLNYMIFMLPAFILMIVTQLYVNSAYRKWSRVPSLNRMTGAQAAQTLIRRFNLYGVQVEGIRGNLTDHYDPRSKVLRLSEDLPIVIEIVDTAEKIESFIPVIDNTITEGLATVENVHIRLYRSSKADSNTGSAEV